MTAAASPTVLRLQRDPDFWVRVAGDDNARVSLLGKTPEFVGVVAQHPRCIPLATAHGGFLLSQLDDLARGFDVHAIFESDRPYRETFDASVALFTLLFRSAHYVTVHEIEGDASFKPPVSFGFRLAADWSPSMLDEQPIVSRTWILTANDWRESPAGKRAISKGAS